jgi:hypothetical protein
MELTLRRLACGNDVFSTLPPYCEPFQLSPALLAAIDNGKVSYSVTTVTFLWKLAVRHQNHDES